MVENFFELERMKWDFSPDSFYIAAFIFSAVFFIYAVFLVLDRWKNDN